MGDKYTVIRDTREKDRNGWIFPASKFCDGTDNKRLKTGDYTLVGYEDLLCIERKGTVAEFSQNITQKRFERELVRMDDFKYAYLVLEFTMDELLQYPVGAKLPPWIKRKVRAKGPFILLRYIEITQRHPNVQIILAGNRGQEVARSIFKRTVENESNSRQDSTPKDEG